MFVVNLPKVSLYFKRIERLTLNPEQTSGVTLCFRIGQTIANQCTFELIFYKSLIYPRFHWISGELNFESWTLTLKSEQIVVSTM